MRHVRIHRSRRRPNRVIHPKGWPNREVDKLHKANLWLNDVKDAAQAIVVVLGKDRPNKRLLAQAISTFKATLKDKEGLGPTPPCSFCERPGVTMAFTVGACDEHRQAYIDGKIGKNACVSLSDHKFVKALRELVIEHRDLDFNSTRAGD